MADQLTGRALEVTKPCGCGRAARRPRQNNCSLCNREAQKRHYMRKKGAMPQCLRSHKLRLVLLAIALFPAACKQPATVGFVMPEPIPAEEALHPSAVHTLAASLLGSPPSYAAVRVIYPPTCCSIDNAGGNPIVGIPTMAPVAGSQFTQLWHVEAIDPRPRAVALLCSTRPAPAPVSLNPNGLPGCWLLVHPDWQMIPEQSTSGLLTYRPETGVVRLLWTPAPSLAGTQLLAQIVVAAPGANPGGLLFGPAVELSIGTL